MRHINKKRTISLLQYVQRGCFLLLIVCFTYGLSIVTYSTFAYGKNDLGGFPQSFGDSMSANEPAPFAPFDSMVPKDAPSLEMLELLSKGGFDKLPPNVQDFLMKNTGLDPVPILISPPTITKERTTYSDKTSMNATVPKTKVPGMRNLLEFGAIIPGMEPMFRPSMTFGSLPIVAPLKAPQPNIKSAEKAQNPQEPQAGKGISPMPKSGKGIELSGADGKSLNKSKEEQENQVAEKKEISTQLEDNTDVSSKSLLHTNNDASNKNGLGKNGVDKNSPVMSGDTPTPSINDIETNKVDTNAIGTDINTPSVNTPSVNAIGTNAIGTDADALNTNTPDANSIDANTPDTEQNQKSSEKNSDILPTQKRENQEEKPQLSLDKEVLNENEVVQEDLAHVLSQLSLNDLNLRAKDGDVSAQYKLGLKYYNGTDISKNKDEALKWIKKSAIGGHLPAMISMGNFLEEGVTGSVNLEGATSWYAQAADRGFADGFFHLAQLYDTKKIGSGKLAERIAMDYYKQAADLNHPRALYNLALFYDANQGTAGDIKQAIQLYRASAQLGDARAQFQVGLLYESGKYLSKDDALASQWYHKAAMQGLAEAQYLLAGMYQQGKGVPKDLAKAIQLYEAAANQGFADAQLKFESLSMKNGDGTLQKLEEVTTSP